MWKCCKSFLKALLTVQVLLMNVSKQQQQCFTQAFTIRLWCTSTAFGTSTAPINKDTFNSIRPLSVRSLVDNTNQQQIGYNYDKQQQQQQQQQYLRQRTILKFRHNSVYDDNDDDDYYYIKSVLYLGRRNNNNNNDDQQKDSGDVLVRAINIVFNVLSQTVQYLGNTSVVAIVLLCGLFLLQPLLQSVLTVVLFIFFTYTGKSIIVLNDDIDDLAAVTTTTDDDDVFPIRLRIEGLSLFFSFITAALLFPPSTELNIPFESIDLTIPVLSILLLTLIIGTKQTIQSIQNDERLSADEKLLYRWDLQFRKQENDRDKN